MRNLLCIIIGICTGLAVYGQCPYNNTLNLVQSAPESIGEIYTDSCIKGGQYDRITDMQGGYIYRISTCPSWDYDTRITIYAEGGGTSMGFNDDYCMFASEVIFTAPFSGSFDILIDEYPCVSGTDCLILEVELVSTVPFSCPEGTIPEVELCNESLNNGCVFGEPFYEDLLPGQTKCGEVYVKKTGSFWSADMDYYQFTLDQPGTITVRAESQFMGILFLHDHSNCYPYLITEDSLIPGTRDSIVYALIPGQYALQVMPLISLVSCGSSNKYYVSLNLEGDANYCTQGLYSNSNSQIGLNDFSLNTINNTNSGFSPGGYGDFTGMSTDLIAGHSYEVTMNGTYYSDYYVTIWMDNNDNTSFEILEKLLFSYHIVGGSPYTATVTIPADASVGPHRLRMRLSTTDVYCACCVLFVGETEDYMVNILPYQPQLYSLAGTLTYQNSESTPINDTWIYLLSQGNIVDSSFTTAEGNYQFNNVLPGEYTMEVNCTKPWGGVNATDALKILNHYTGINLLNGILLLAADINANNVVNSADALIVAKRIVGLINSFIPGDWAFSPLTVAITTADIYMDIKGVCYGDVDGSL